MTDSVLCAKMSTHVRLRSAGLMTVYAATKNYVNHMTVALEQEYGPQGIRFQSLMPNFVSTAMSKQRPSLLVPSPKQYVKSALTTLGQDLQSSGYFWHELQCYVLSLVPSKVLESQAFKMHLSIRKRAIKKAEREAAGGGKKDK
eukprot:m.234823 g.234823  ORF g.234823 m.234823 type:complete len:144 (-) comp15757_c0_seq12:2660-3091(-)